MSNATRVLALGLSGVLALAIVTKTCASGGEPKQSHAAIAGKPDLIIRDADKELKATKIVSILEARHEAHTSLIWCSTSNLAWDSLRRLVNDVKDEKADAGQALTFAEPWAEGEALNASAGVREWLDSGSYIAMSGWGRDGVLDKVKGALKSKFGGAASPAVLPMSVDPDEFLAYAYLFKNLEFATPFIRSPGGMRFAGGEKRMKAFGLWREEGLRNWSEISRQVHLLWYESPTDWGCELMSKSTGDHLIIARLAPGATLRETVKQIDARAAAQAKNDPKPLRFDSHDRLEVPLLNFDITKHYDDWQSRVIRGSSQTVVIKYAIQNIRLRLDEKGAVLKSDMAITGVTAQANAPKPKMLVCDGPFVVVMKQEGQETPYFAAWVDNAEVLVKR
jgi:hypothetical protein